MRKKKRYRNKNDNDYKLVMGPDFKKSKGEKKKYKEQNSKMKNNKSGVAEEVGGGGPLSEELYLPRQITNEIKFVFFKHIHNR